MKGYRATIIIFALMLITAGEVYSQPVIQWTQLFNGLQDTTDISYDITVDAAGNSYITGKSIKLLGLLSGAVTISYDPDGNQRWRKEYDGLLDDAGVAIILDNTQQFVYVCGYTNGLLNLTAADFIIIKYRASDGAQIWFRTYNYGILGDDRATGITIDRQNNPAITGYSQGFLILLTPYDYATVKYDTAGNQLWVARYNGPGNNDDRSTSIASDSLSNIIVTGTSMNSSNHDYTTVKYNPAGVQQWTAIYNGPGNNEDRAYAIVVDSSNNIFVTGESMGSGTNYDYATVKYNSAGSQQWASRYDGPGNNEDRAYAIVVDNSGDPVVTGSSRSGSTAGTEDYGTVKYNTTNGGQQWASRYNGPGNNEDRAYAIVVDNSNNVVVTGSSRSTGSAGSEDFATLEYNNTGGTQTWVTRYNGTGNNEDRAYAIVVDNSNSIFITGLSRHNSLQGSEDYITIKYSPKELVILPGETEIPSEFRVYQNYPNPFNPTTTIRLDISEYAMVRFAVYDILGNEKGLLIDGNMKPGSYNVNWDAGSYTSGIYFYRVTMNDRMVTGKMMLIK